MKYNVNVSWWDSVYVKLKASLKIFENKNFFISKVWQIDKNILRKVLENIFFIYLNLKEAFKVKKLDTDKIYDQINWCIIFRPNFPYLEG